MWNDRETENDLIGHRLIANAVIDIDLAPQNSASSKVSFEMIN